MLVSAQSSVFNLLNLFRPLRVQTNSTRVLRFKCRIYASTSNSKLQKTAFLNSCQTTSPPATILWSPDPRLSVAVLRIGGCTGLLYQKLNRFRPHGSAASVPHRPPARAIALLPDGCSQPRRCNAVCCIEALA